VAIKKKQNNTSAKRNPSIKSNKSSNKKTSINFNKSSFFLFSKQMLFRLLAVAVLCFIGLMLYLDLLVTNKFEGKKWALPAHVYTRSMDVYVGQTITQKNIVDELRELGYKSIDNAKDLVNTGQYNSQENNLYVYQRAFTFWDVDREAQKVRIYWQNGQINRILNNGNDLDAIRVEPRLFGSVSPLNHEDRSLITLEETPQYLIDALLVMEDRKFYKHWGVDPLGIARAMLRNIRAGRTVQGGSTLTQQLVKNYFLSPDRTIKRKLTEMMMAFLLELHYSKEEILQAYLNEVNLGQSGNRAIHGFGLGSEFLFGRPLNELDLHQQATLAGMVKGPSSYNPIRNPNRSKKRRDLVLSVMAEQGYITQELAEEEKKKALGSVGSTKKQALRSYPAFTDYVRKQLQDRYQSKDLNEVGLSIFTTLDPRAQSHLDKAIESTLEKLNKANPKQNGKIQVAAVSVRTDNGEVLAISGGNDVVTGGFNRALQAKRPIGSLVKPFVLVSALQKYPQKYQLNSLILDEKIVIKQKGSDDWLPQNYDNVFHGNVMLMDALARSYNVPFVKIGMDVGVDVVADTLYNYGLKKQPRQLPSLLLGSLELSPLEVSQLYLTLASGGFRTPLTAVSSVLDGEKQPLDSFELKIEQVISSDINNMVTHGLQEVMRTGTASQINRSFPVTLGLAGKTGTTDNYRDSWFAGFSGNVLTIVWLGRDDNKPAGLTGAAGAGKVWKNYMSRLDLLPLEPFFVGNVRYVDSPNYVKLEDKSLEYSCEYFRSVPVSGYPEAPMQCGVNDDGGSEGDVPSNSQWSLDSNYDRVQKRRAVDKIENFLDRLFN
jgi:penicillin-binding protein 1B